MNHRAPLLLAANTTIQILRGIWKLTKEGEVVAGRLSFDNIGGSEHEREVKRVPTWKQLAVWLSVDQNLYKSTVIGLPDLSRPLFGKFLQRLCSRSSADRPRAASWNQEKSGKEKRWKRNESSEGSKRIRLYVSFLSRTNCRDASMKLYQLKWIEKVETQTRLDRYYWTKNKLK